MNDLPTHLALFAVAALVIVGASAAFSETEDGAALRLVPRRLVYFVVGCGVLTAAMLVLEHTVASVR